ncbi:hypothetical protein Ancab_026863 [Ancistrocladus abbreviatus]
MEEETKANVEVAEEVVENPAARTEPNKVKGVKREDEETSLGGEFIKVEKDDEPSSSEHRLERHRSSREILEAEEKIKELGLELEKVTKALKDSESENSQLKDELSFTKEKLEDSAKKHEELELNLKKLQERNLEAEKNFNEQLKALQESLEEQMSKHKELVSVKEAFSSLELELESSQKNMGKLEQELLSSAVEKRKFEDLHKESGSLAESETKKALEFERLLEVARLSAKEMEDQMDSLQGELKGLYENITENEKVEAALKRTSIELSATLEELQATKESLRNLEKTISLKDVLINEMTQELKQLKISEQQLQEDVPAMGSLLSSTKDELQMKISELEEIQLKLKEVLRARESLEAALRTQEEEVVMVNEELVRVAADKQMLEGVRSELTLAQEKLESIENDLKAAGMREGMLMENLKSAEDQLEQQGKVIELATARNTELESLHESLVRDSELKIQEMMANFTNKDAEAKSFSEKLKLLEDQIQIYQTQTAEAAHKAASLTEELNQSNMKLAAVESSNEELKRMIIEADEKAAQSLSENNLLVDTNTRLKNKLNELQELLDSAIAEKETTARQVASHVNTIIKLTEQHKKSSELHSVAEACILEIQTQLEETFQKLAHKESEVNELSERLTFIEGQMNRYESEARETSGIADSRKVELEQTLLKLQGQEKLVDELQVKLGQLETDTAVLTEANMRINEELAGSESKLNDLQAKLLAALVDKDDALEQLHLSKEAVEDLTQQLTSERQMLQSEISSVKEENQQLHETSAEAEKELKYVIVQLEGQLKEFKSSEEALKAELENLRVESTQKSALQVRLNELEEQFLTAEAQLKEEVKSVKAAAFAREANLTSSLEEHVQKIHDRDTLSVAVQQLEQELQLAQTTITELKDENSRLVSEREGAMKHLSDELEAKSQQVVLLEKQTKELQEKLQTASSLSSIKNEESSLGKQQEGIEVKSRDIGSSISTPIKRKSKKKPETSSPPTVSATEAGNQTTESSPVVTIKYVLGVALVSIIFGIVLGKRY